MARPVGEFGLHRGAGSGEQAGDRAARLSRRVLLSGLSVCGVASCIAWAAVAQAPDLNQAFTLYRNRRFAGPGLAGTRTAIDIAQAVLNSNPGPEKTVDCLILLAETQSFVALVGGDADDVQAKLFNKAATHADRILVETYGVNWADDPAQIANTLKTGRTDAELDRIALALVLSVTSLAGFGDKSGVVTSLGLVPNIRKRINVFSALGKSQKFFYIPEAVNAAIYYRVPGLLGGDMQKAVDMFTFIISHTQAPNAKFSVNGLANYYGCQALSENGDTDEAKEIATGFIAAPLTVFPPEAGPENEYYQLLTKKILPNL